MGYFDAIKNNYVLELEEMCRKLEEENDELRLEAEESKRSILYYKRQLQQKIVKQSDTELMSDIYLTGTNDVT